MEKIQIDPLRPVLPVPQDPIANNPRPQPVNGQNRLDPLEEAGYLQSFCDICSFCFDVLSSIFCFFCQKDDPETNWNDQLLLFFRGVIPEEKLDQILAHRDQIHKISLGGRTRYQDHEKLIEFLKNFPEIRTVYLPEDTSAKLLKDLREACPKISFLDCCAVAATADVPAIVQEITQFPHLKGLDLSKRRMDKGVFTSDHIQQFALSLKELELLNLSGNKGLEGAGILELVKANPSLRILVLEGCDKGGNKQALAQMAAVTPKLEALILNGMYGKYIGDNKLLPWLVDHAHLKCLCLGDQSTHYLLADIKKLPLEYLDLSVADAMGDSQQARKAFDEHFDWACKIPTLQYFILGDQHLLLNELPFEELKGKTDKEFCCMGLLNGALTMAYVLKDRNEPLLTTVSKEDEFVSLNRVKQYDRYGYYDYLINPFIDNLNNK